MHLISEGFHWFFNYGEGAYKVYVKDVHMKK